jgi:hypothetical protein
LSFTYPSVISSCAVQQRRSLSTGLVSPRGAQGTHVAAREDPRAQAALQLGDLDAAASHLQASDQPGSARIKRGW